MPKTTPTVTRPSTYQKGLVRQQVDARRPTPLVIQRTSDYVAIVQYHASVDTRSIPQIARDAGVSPGTVAKHVAGEITRPTFRTVVSLLRAFGYAVQARRGE